MSNLVRPATASSAPDGMPTYGLPVFRRRWATLAVLCVPLLLISLAPGGSGSSWEAWWSSVGVRRLPPGQGARTA